MEIQIQKIPIITCDDRDLFLCAFV